MTPSAVASPTGGVLVQSQTDANKMADNVFMTGMGMPQPPNGIILSEEGTAPIGVNGEETIIIIEGVSIGTTITASIII